MGALANSRQLAEMFIVMEDMIILREMPVNPDSVLLINTREEVIALKASGDTLTLGNRLAPGGPAFAMVFPNPARQSLQVKMEQPFNLQLTLFSATGQAARRVKYELAREASLNTAGLPPGAYFLEIRTGEAVQIEKVVLE